MRGNESLFIEHLSRLAPAYDVILSDVWGVIHNGVEAFPQACDALARFRANGGTVILITNAPRPSPDIAQMLRRLAVPPSTYDGIASSGDLTRDLVVARARMRVFHLGPERDRSIFSGLDVNFAPAETADYAICSGLLDDETETPEDYRALLGRMRGQGLSMICANPDIVVERGDRLVYCAGALAELYSSLGGDVFYAGKPHRPIYELALARAAAARGEATALARVLAIGDSVRTDLAGARRLGVDCVFVTGGIHAAEFDPGLRTQASMAAFFGPAGSFPAALMARLSW
ncbi:MAG: TIGR01459 family HAD-type hydrolase [Proteobacteria bacterium]|nr:TIGR01459 family HAD-type hydrolase [Pseudomonadota bacterium]